MSIFISSTRRDRLLSDLITYVKGYLSGNIHPNIKQYVNYISEDISMNFTYVAVFYLKNSKKIYKEKKSCYIRVQGVMQIVHIVWVVDAKRYRQLAASTVGNRIK